MRSGKARYIGASSCYSWQFAQALALADRHGWARFVSMQNHYNLVYREEEREMIPLCRAEGVAIIPWSPLARGLLARDRPAGAPGPTRRSETDVLTGSTRTRPTRTWPSAVVRWLRVTVCRPRRSRWPGCCISRA